MSAKKNEKNKKGEQTQSQTITENRKARHRFEIVEQVECGMMLKGTEVKSLRQGKISLDEAYVRVRAGELWLVGADIPEYSQATIWNHDPKRPRKLLVHKKQLDKLIARAKEKGLTLIPLRMYFNDRGIAKAMVGVGRGKKMFDKRDSLKKEDVKRQIDRQMKRNR
jgi:SsrA-binding protein